MTHKCSFSCLSNRTKESPEHLRLEQLSYHKISSYGNLGNYKIFEFPANYHELRFQNNRITRWDCKLNTRKIKKKKKKKKRGETEISKQNAPQAISKLLVLTSYSRYSLAVDLEIVTRGLHFRVFQAPWHKYLHPNIIKLVPPCTERHLTFICCFCSLFGFKKGSSFHPFREISTITQPFWIHIIN